MATQTDELLTYLFDAQPNPLVQPMATWVASSRRFVSFATTFRDKIRKKIRTTQGQESLLDLQLELETAYLLLQERALSVAYEPEQSKGIRSPDFAVTFTTSLTFMVEVTRVQADVKNNAGEIGEGAAATPPFSVRLADTVVSKLSQLLHQRANILFIAIEATRLTEADIRNAMLSLQQRVERNDSTILQGYGFLDRADFFRHYQRLSEVLVQVPDLEGNQVNGHLDQPTGETFAAEQSANYPLPQSRRIMRTGPTASWRWNVKEREPIAGYLPPVALSVHSNKD